MNAITVNAKNRTIEMSNTFAKAASKAAPPADARLSRARRRAQFM